MTAYGGLPELTAFKLAPGLYVILFIAQALLFARLSPRIEQTQTAVMKIGYDGLLWGAFRKIRPPEESK